MATCRDIITRALRRIAVVDAVGSSVAAEDASSGLGALNELFDAWAVQGVDTKFREVFTTGYALDDTFWFFVPPADVDADTLLRMEYAGTWNATTNAPALASSDGTHGQFYRVETAGSTELDDVDSWGVDDALIFGRRNRGYQALYDPVTFNATDRVWLKARSSRSLEGAVIANLAMRLADEYGVSPAPTLVADARRGWVMIQATYIVPGVPVYDAGIVYTSGRRIGWY